MNEKPREFQPIRCRKCGKVTDFAESASCRGCGVFLKGTPSDSSFRRQGKAARLTLRVLATVGIACLLLAAAAFGLKSYRHEAPTAHGVGIPEESWFHPALLNLYRPHPTVAEILAKYEEVNSNSLKADQIQSAVMNGKVSLAVGDCATEECRNEPMKLNLARRGLLAAVNQLDPSYANSNPNSPVPYYRLRHLPKAVNVEAEIKESWVQPYVDFGEIMLRVKLPNRMSAEVQMIDISSPGRKVFHAEGFNGVNGWKHDKNLDAGGNVMKSTIGELDDRETEDLKRRMELWDRTFNADAMKYEGLAKINGRACYVLSEQTGPALSPEKYYFDAVSGHLIKSDVEGFSIYFDDYKTMNGVLVPGAVYYRQIEIGGYHSWTQIKVDRWDFNVDVADALFDKPRE